MNANYRINLTHRNHLKMNTKGESTLKICEQKLNLDNKCH